MTTFVPAVDYTSRDYSSILSDMQALIPNFTPSWTNRDPSDFGMVLVELFAYMGDIMSYYIDRSANEAMINTASQRQSLLDIASLLGYVPTLATPASTTVTFTNNSQADITVPGLTQVSTSLVSNATTSQVIFETSNDIVVPASTTSVSLSSASGVASSSSITVTGTNGGSTITVTSPTNPLVAGMAVTGTGIQPNVYISTVTGTGPYTVTLSSPLLATAIGTYNFGAVAQYTSSIPHGLVTGQIISISGFSPSGYNNSGTTIVVTSTTSFTSNNSTLGTSSGTGTATAAVAGGANQTSVIVTQGQTVANEVIGTSNGLPAQIYQLANTSVINNSINIVINGTNYAPVAYLVDYGNFDPVFTTFTDETGITYIRFGDGVSGRVPPNGSTIYATYRVGGGVIGNVPAGLIKYVINLPGLTSVPTGLSVSCTAAAVGGADPESNDSIRYNAPLSLRSLNRAVSTNDHASLATQVVGVAKASAQANTYSAVTIYVLPSGDTGVSASDNSTQTTTFTKKVGDVVSYMSDKTSASTTVSVQPPKWVGVYINVNITVGSTYNQNNVKTNVITTIQNLHYVDNVNFGETKSLSALYNVINAVTGVTYSKITKYTRADQDQTYVTTTKALTSGVATIGVSGSAAIPVGTTISVTGVDSTFNGTFVVTSSTSSSVSYQLAAANVTSTASTAGSVTALVANDVNMGVGELATLYYLGTVASSTTPWIGSLTVAATGGVTN
jgi:Baseplate J-like protein